MWLGTVLEFTLETHQLHQFNLLHTRTSHVLVTLELAQNTRGGGTGEDLVICSCLRALSLVKLLLDSQEWPSSLTATCEAHNLFIPHSISLCLFLEISRPSTRWNQFDSNLRETL